MRRLTRTEKAAAAAVLAMAAGAAGTGAALLKRYTRLMLQKASARFREEEAFAGDDQTASGETTQAADGKWKEKEIKKDKKGVLS